jgi:hypothetical protein
VPARKKAARGGAKKRLTPRSEARGPAAAEIALDPQGPELGPLAQAVREAGGVVIGAYREPFAGHALLFATLPREAVEPTPFQRDLSPTHVKRLAQNARVKQIIAALQQRGFRSPYLRSYVVARINPVRFTSKQDAKPPMELPAALTRMAAAARKFDVASVRERDLALVAAVAGDPE